MIKKGKITGFATSVILLT